MAITVTATKTLAFVNALEDFKEMSVNVRFYIRVGPRFMSSSQINTRPPFRID